MSATSDALPPVEEQTYSGSRDWFWEREVDFGPLADQASLWAGAPQRLS